MLFWLVTRQKRKRNNKSTVHFPSFTNAITGKQPQIPGLISHIAQAVIGWKNKSKKKSRSKPPPDQIEIVFQVIKSQFNQQTVKSLLPSTDAFGEKDS